MKEWISVNIMNELNTKIWNFVLSNQLVRQEAFFYRPDQSAFKDFIWDKKTLKKNGY